MPINDPNIFNITWPDGTKNIISSMNVHYVTKHDYLQSQNTTTYSRACLSHMVSIDVWRNGEHSGKCKNCGEVVIFAWSHQDVFDLMQKLQNIHNPPEDQIKLLMSAYQVLRNNIEAERRVLDVYDSALNMTETALKELFTRSELE